MISLTVAVAKKGIPTSSLTARWYQHLGRVVRASGYLLPKSIIIALIDDATMRGINSQTRGIDKVTDALSFLYSPNEGELLIAPNQARRQFKSFKSTSVKDELKRLVVHGFLHLAGLDHKKLQERKDMEQAMRTILMQAKNI